MRKMLLMVMLTGLTACSLFRNPYGVGFYYENTGDKTKVPLVDLYVNRTLRKTLTPDPSVINGETVSAGDTICIIPRGTTLGYRYIESPNRAGSAAIAFRLISNGEVVISFAPENAQPGEVQATPSCP